MLNIFLDEKANMVKYNDFYFNKYTFSQMEFEKAYNVIKSIDGVLLQDNMMFKSKITGGEVTLDCLSTGCKTVLNVIFNKDRVISALECGVNALYYLYQHCSGSIYLKELITPYFDNLVIDVCVMVKDKQLFFKDTYSLREWYRGYVENEN